MEIAQLEIIVNGQPCQVHEGTSVEAFLDQRQLSDRPVAVEINRELVPKARHAEHLLHPGDRVEIVTLVGGG